MIEREPRARGRGSIARSLLPSASRRGFTLLEMLVAIAVMLIVSGVVMAGLATSTSLEQRRVAKEIAAAVGRLHDEAVLRNRTYRITFDLDAKEWAVEETEKQVLIFDKAEAREKFDEALRDKLSDADDEERAVIARQGQFSATQEAGISGVRKLPDATRFVSVFTPQYEEPVRPHTERELQHVDEDDPPRRASVHLFANGFVEPAVIQLGSVDDAKEAYTIIVDPLSGRVDMKEGLVDHDEAFADLPTEAPRLDD